ncbi:hypothetical protein CHUAL_011236 [Chamberlinius hualienensis]
MVSSDKIFRPLVTFFKLYGVLHDKTSTSTKFKIGLCYFLIVDVLLVCNSIVFLVHFANPDHRFGSVILGSVVFAPDVGYLGFVVWKIWLNSNNCYQMILAMKGLQVSKKAEIVTTNTVTTAKKIFTVLLILFSAISFTVLLLTVSEVSNLSQLLMLFYIILSPLKVLFPILFCLFFNSITTCLSCELDNINELVRISKSPYRSAKIISSAVKEYIKLEQLAKSANDVFSFAVFATVIINGFPMAMNYSAFNLNKPEAPLFLIAYSPYYMTFIFCLQAMKSAAAVNSKRNLLFAALASYTASPTPGPIELTMERFNLIEWVNHVLLTGEDWFTFPFDENFSLAVYQNIVCFGDMHNAFYSTKQHS